VNPMVKTSHESSSSETPEHREELVVTVNSDCCKPQLGAGRGGEACVCVCVCVCVLFPFEQEWESP
jgi:hypothetical protein